MKKIKFNALNRSNFWEKLPDARHTQASRAGVLIARGPLCDQNSSIISYTSISVIFLVRSSAFESQQLSTSHVLQNRLRRIQDFSKMFHNSIN